MGKVLAVLVLLLVAAGAVWHFAGQADPPVIEIAQPTQLVGQTGQLDVTVRAPGAKLTRLQISLQQGGERLPLADLSVAEVAALERQGENAVRYTRAIGKRDLPALKAGPVTVVVSATRPVLFGLREIPATASHTAEVRLAPPVIAIASRFHFINHGGSEMVVYRVRPADVASGVRVGDIEYPGYPATGAGIEGADPGLRVAFFALLWDQPADTPIMLYARDDVGNEARAGFDHRVFDKKFKESRITLSDGFLQKVVPAILYNTPDFTVENPSDLLASYLRINGDLRRINRAMIADLAKSTAPQILWQGPFKQLINTAVEAGFADQRTYVYNGEAVDHQVHLGFDLASTANAPVLAANSGRIVHAGWLGIFGNCVIIDHGMGLQSLYAHLSAVDVAVGDDVQKNQQLGLSGSTGLAGGDHLHFTMLLAGHAVTPIDWWSEQWVQDRILRKLREATPGEAAAPASAGGG